MVPAKKQSVWAMIPAADAIHKAVSGCSNNTRPVLSELTPES